MIGLITHNSSCRRSGKSRLATVEKSPSGSMELDDFRTLSSPCT